MEETYFFNAKLITTWIAGLVMGFLMRNVEVKPGLKVKNYMIPVYTGWCVWAAQSSLESKYGGCTFDTWQYE